MLFLTPKIIETRKSAVNGEIKVVKLLGAYSLVVGRYTQSGGLVKTVWDKALRFLQPELDDGQLEVLLLGLGAGTSARLVNRYFPKARLTGVELDPEFIDLAKKYFDFDRLANLKVVIGDATRLVKTYRRKGTKFDLILVDLYLGSTAAPGSDRPEFLTNLKALLAPGGSAVFNQLIVKGRTRTQAQFAEKLAAVFPVLVQIKTPVNRLYQAKCKS